jgi:hypothetical protein
MWQSIFIRRDGTGVLTSLVGEISGAPQRPFRLPRGQFVKLRRLIAGARTARRGANRPGDYIYSLHIAGQPPLGLEGPMPRQLSSLVGFLGNLMLSYCC